MGKFKDLTGQRFGRLVAISAEKDADGRRYIWYCKCDCGNYIKAQSASLTTGVKQSCGCLRKEQLSERNKVHGHADERLYGVWKGMKSRCYNPHHRSYPKYGGRGISVCDEWRNDYMRFREWAYANGYKEDADTQQCSLDRIDVNGNYEPSNCRWADAFTQANNSRRNLHYTFNGETKTISEWSVSTGIPRKTLTDRLKAGWSIERTLTEPIRKW